MRITIPSIKQQLKKVDWNLFIFLVLFLNVKLLLKVLALCFIYFRRFNFSFRFSVKQSGLPLFYPAMIGIALINFIIFSLYREHHYTVMFLTGTAFWIMCILALHQVALSVNHEPPQKIHNTILLFFVVNSIVSAAILFAIIVKTGEINPYRYQGLYQQYFISTGDYIRGLTFDTSTTNAILNAFGLVYFLSRKQMLMSLLCMMILLLTCSNFTNLLVLVCLVMLFIFRSDREQKSIIIVQLALVIIFMTNVSPQNNKYATYIVEKAFCRKEPQGRKAVNTIPVTAIADNLLTEEERKRKTAQLYLDSMARVRMLAESIAILRGEIVKQTPVFDISKITAINIHTPEYQHRQDSSEARLQAIVFLHQIEHQSGPLSFKIDSLPGRQQLPGKFIAWQQTFRFMREHPAKLIAGNGMGKFSSKLAFRATGLRVAGGYPSKYKYVGNDFRDNHLALYLSFFVEDSGLHSISNTPNSFYDQLLGEYGLAGVACFLFFYLWYFAKGLKKLTYGLPVLFIMSAAFFTDYWFEQLSVVIMFELLGLLNKRETVVINQHRHA